MYGISPVVAPTKMIAINIIAQITKRQSLEFSSNGRFVLSGVKIGGGIILRPNVPADRKKRSNFRLLLGKSFCVVYVLQINASTAIT